MTPPATGWPQNPAMTATTAPGTARSPRYGVLKRCAINQGACLAIAFVLWMLRIDASFWIVLAYSLLIGNACWALIDGGRALAARARFALYGGIREWPGWAWMAPIVVIGTVTGYAVGSTLADALLGIRSPSLLASRPTVILSVFTALGVSYIFYARERMHSQRLEAEAAQRLTSDVQLKLLQSQLEPHMLFNTLANLRVLIGLDPVQAQTMLDHLIRFLRTTLASTRTPSHPLSAEFDALGDYLSLMAVRMGPRLQSNFDLPADLRDIPVPPLLLQPVLENAIKHGLEPQVEGGRIDVSARRQGASLLLRVHDTGAGLSASHPTAATAGTGFGLEQVRQRLTALYGDRATLTLQTAAEAGAAPGGAVPLAPTPSKGTVVLIELPFDLPLPPSPPAPRNTL
jgi:signal transduction histidine kinase